MRLDGDSALGPLIRSLGRAPLPESALKLLWSLPHEERAVEANQVILRQGEKTRHCYVLATGFIMRTKVVAAGKRQILSLEMAGDITNLDCAFLEHADFNVQTLSPCHVLAVDFRSLCAAASRDPSIAHAISVELARQAAIAREWIANIGSRDARTRIAHLLCEIGVNLEKAGIGRLEDYHLPITQDQLADAVGLSEIHVSRVLRALQEEGIILRERRAIRVADTHRLRSTGDFDPAYLGREIVSPGA